MEALKSKAAAKVNLGLKVIGLKEGYHLLDMIMAPIDLYDELIIEKADQDELICDEGLLENNILFKVLDKLRGHGLKDHYRIRLIKNIPAQAGLGGGSSDAASLLKTLIDLEELKISKEELNSIAFEIGADVPFFLQDGFARVSGFGEIVESIQPGLKLQALLFKPEYGISTPQAFKVYDQLNLKEFQDIDKISQLQKALFKGNQEKIFSEMENDLEKAALEIEPNLARDMEMLRDSGALKVLMSGSGSSLLAFYPDESSLEKAQKQLSGKKGLVRKVEIG